jgi:hypothetical protein
MLSSRISRKALVLLLFAASTASAQRATPVDILQMTPIPSVPTTTCLDPSSHAPKSCVYWNSLDGHIHQRLADLTDVVVGSGGGGGGAGTATDIQLLAGDPVAPSDGAVWVNTLTNLLKVRTGGVVYVLGSDALALHKAGSETITGSKHLAVGADLILDGVEGSVRYIKSTRPTSHTPGETGPVVVYSAGDGWSSDGTSNGAQGGTSALIGAVGGDGSPGRSAGIGGVGLFTGGRAGLANGGTPANGGDFIGQGGVASQDVIGGQAGRAILGTDPSNTRKVCIASNAADCFGNGNIPTEAGSDLTNGWFRVGGAFKLNLLSTGTLATLYTEADGSVKGVVNGAAGTVLTSRGPNLSPVYGAAGGGGANAVQIQGSDVSAGAPSNKDVLCFNASVPDWEPCATPSGTSTQVLHGGTTPSYGSVALSTDVSGTLPIAGGGSNTSTALSGSSIMISNGTAIVQGAAGTTTTLLHGNAAGAPTFAAASLTADVTGVLHVANGGSNSSTALTGSRLMTSNAGATAVVEGNVYDYQVAEQTSSTTGGGPVDVSFTIPAARGSSSVKGFLVTDVAFRVTQAPAGGGSVNVRCGTSVGGQELILTTTASGAAGTVYGDLPAEQGSACDATRMNNCYVAGGATVTCRIEAPVGTVSPTPLKGVWTFSGKQR